MFKSFRGSGITEIMFPTFKRKKTTPKVIFFLLNAGRREYSKYLFKILPTEAASGIFGRASYLVFFYDVLRDGRTHNDFSSFPVPNHSQDAKPLLGFSQQLRGPFQTSHATFAAFGPPR